MLVIICLVLDFIVEWMLKGMFFLKGVVLDILRGLM